MTSGGWLTRIAEAEAGLPDAATAARILAAGEPGTDQVVAALAATRADLRSLGSVRLPIEVAGALATAFDAADTESPSPAPAEHPPGTTTDTESDSRGGGRAGLGPNAAASAGPHTVGLGHHTAGPDTPAPEIATPSSTGASGTGPGNTGPGGSGPSNTGHHSAGPSNTGPSGIEQNGIGPGTTGSSTTASSTNGHHTAGPSSTGPSSTGPHSIRPGRRRGRRRRGLLLTAAAAALVGVVLTGPGAAPTDLAAATGRVLVDQTRDVGALDDPATLASCLVGVGVPAPAGPLLAGRPIRLDGVDGTLLVLSTGKRGVVRAVVVTPSCGRVLADLTVGG
jgi:hypothetical protein